MRAHYDFSKLRERPNPYLKFVKQSVTIRLDRATVDFFKAMAARTGLRYQHLINLYLNDCAARGRELTMKWPGRDRPSARPREKSSRPGRIGSRPRTARGT